MEFAKNVKAPKIGTDFTNKNLTEQTELQDMSQWPTKSDFE